MEILPSLSTLEKARIEAILNPLLFGLTIDY
jgi:hypothetical protein